MVKELGGKMSNATTLSREAVHTVVDVVPVEYIQAIISMLEPFGYKIDGDEIITPEGVILPHETVKRVNKRIEEIDENPSLLVPLTDELMAELRKPTDAN
jgi:hypothetical protein